MKVLVINTHSLEKQVLSGVVEEARIIPGDAVVSEKKAVFCNS